MNIITVAEHSFDLDLINESTNSEGLRPRIIDIGCRGLLLLKWFIDNYKFCYFVAVDADKIDGEEYLYKQCAVSNYTGKCSLVKSRDLQATKIKGGDEIDCYTLEDLMKFYNVPFFDLIKIDIEGSEYEVIMSLTKAPATQLSIEFHLHTGVYGMDAVQEMVDKLEDLGYEIAKHELTEAHGCGYNYWDSLFILKS